MFLGEIVGIVKQRKSKIFVIIRRHGARIIQRIGGEASLNKICPKCGFTITPDLVKRVEFDLIECAKCGERFCPGGERLSG